MTQENSVFQCRTCGEKLDGRQRAHKHVQDHYGLFIDNDAKIERKFLMEIMVI